MGEIVSEDHVVQELVRSLEQIPIGVADVLTVLQRLCSEHDPTAMSAVLRHAQTYAHDDLPRLRRLVRLSMRPFEAACHYPLANFPAVMQELAASFPKDEKEVVAIRGAHQHIDELVTRTHVVLQPRPVQQQEEQEQPVQDQQEQQEEQEQVQQQQVEGAFLLANGDGLQQTNGDVKWQGNGDVKWEADGGVQKEALPFIQTTSPSLLSFLGHLGHLASTVVKASDSYLHLNQQLAHMLQPSPFLDSAAALSSLQEKFQLLHPSGDEAVSFGCSSSCLLPAQSPAFRLSWALVFNGS
ncbi:unnamed protein product [Closterium sp. Yama58-4]|nr:unnamed protein product [Closterium sp. Yama58-4]